MAQDGVALAELFRKTLQKDKIILVGHSWGSILGVFMVKAHPVSGDNYFFRSTTIKIPVS
jgi:pimeloyl-ACP methyl ester carboxylesterase